MTTRDASHTIAAARLAVRERAAAVIAVGGDGTVNDVVTGLMQEPGGEDVPLGIVPAGTGNDLATFLFPPPFRPQRIVQALLAGRWRRIDVGCVNDRYFVNNFGWGIEGQVARRVTGLPRAWGRARYVLALLQAVGSYRAAMVQLVIDDQQQTLSLCSLSVANGPATGGGFRLCPAALPDDDILDVFIVQAMTPAALPVALLRVLQGASKKHRYFRLAHGRKMHFISDTPLPAHADGNFLGLIDRIFIQILPHRLRLLH